MSAQSATSGSVRQVEAQALGELVGKECPGISAAAVASVAPA